MGEREPERRGDETNTVIAEGIAFLLRMNLFLPPFAYWTVEDWRWKGQQARRIVRNKLGWVTTGFGMGDYEKYGLFLFTLRNGLPSNWDTLEGKLYCEKIMIVEPDQITPYHFHWSKMEDIINRGGGDVGIELYIALEEDDLAESDVAVMIDGVWRTFSAGETVVLKPGQSITLSTRVNHKFWAIGETALVGEVSAVNDDDQYNRFYGGLGGFPAWRRTNLPIIYWSKTTERTLLQHPGLDAGAEGLRTVRWSSAQLDDPGMQGVRHRIPVYRARCPRLARLGGCENGLSVAPDRPYCVLRGTGSPSMLCT